MMSRLDTPSSPGSIFTLWSFPGFMAVSSLPHRGYCTSVKFHPTPIGEIQKFELLKCEIKNDLKFNLRATKDNRKTQKPKQQATTTKLRQQ
jgi:hypothetical protein